MIELETLSTLDEIESERLEEIAGMTEKYGEPNIERVKERYLNSIGYREALHTAFIFSENVEHYLCEHPCVALDPQAYKLARLAGELLLGLYQRLGKLDYETQTENE